MRRYYAVIIVIIITLLFCSCDFDESENSFRGGELLDNDRMSEIKDKFVTEKPDEEKSEAEATDVTTEKHTEKQTEKQTETVVVESYTQSAPEQSTESESETLFSDEQSNIVYWTKSGSVWHVTDQCHHLKKSKNIQSGSVEEAMESGKEKVCSSCGK